MKHRADIDGLRALAVLPVVFYHVGWGFPGGFVGVDIFFVISGFLISGILLQDLERGRFSLLGFYDRRVRRILPALSFMLIGVLTASWWLLLPYELDQLGQHLTKVALFLSNYWLMSGAGDYWSVAAEDNPLLHTWSLAVEEQFYIFMPILLWVLFRFFRKQLGWVLLLLFLCSLAHGIHTSYTDPIRAFYLLPSRAWELLLGALVFLACRRDRSHEALALREGLSLLGLSLIIGSLFLINGDMAFPGIVVLAPTMGAALLIYANAGHQTRSSRILCWKPFQFIGLISYSLYLWHWPTIVFLKAYRYPAQLTLVDQVWIFIASIVFSAISWYIIEQPFRNKRLARMPRRTVFAGGVVLVLFVGISLVIRKTDGYPPRFDGKFSPDAEQLLISGRDRGYIPFEFNSLRNIDQGGLRIHFSEDRTIPEVVLVGDSHGICFAPAFQEIAVEKQIPMTFFTEGGLKPLFGRNADQNAIIRSYIVEWQPESICLIMRWDPYWTGEDKGDISALNLSETEIADRLHWLSMNCRKLYVCLQVPKLSPDNQSSIKIVWGAMKEQEISTLPIIKEIPLYAETRQQTKVFLEQLKIKNLEILDLGEPFLRDHEIQYRNFKNIFYYDDDHVNIHGAQQAKSLLRSVFPTVNITAGR